MRFLGLRRTKHRVNRGGSWNNNAQNCRSANRNRNTPTNRNNNLGFRVARIRFALGECEWNTSESSRERNPACGVGASSDDSERAPRFSSCGVLEAMTRNEKRLIL